MARYKNDFFSWDDDLDLDEILGEYTEDEEPLHTTVVKESVYVCPDCSKEFKSISGFRGHVMNKHDKNLKGI